MICITGDIHGDLSRFKNPQLKKLKRGDALIICGDFGFIWSGDAKERKILKKLGKKKYDVLFVEGVHENFDELNKYPISAWNGGKIRQISGNLRQLMRGQVFNIAQKCIFTFGGGQSEENTSYLDGNEQAWIKEMPTDEELADGINNLNQVGNKVDYVITYEPPTKLTEFLQIGITDRNHINTYLDELREKIQYEKWFFGKQHLNKLVPPKYYAIFDNVIVADDTRLPKPVKVKPEKLKKNNPQDERNEQNG